jgi:hypothetical protein
MEALTSEILIEMIEVVNARKTSPSTAYAGWGSYIELLIKEFYDAGGNFYTIRNLEDRAFEIAYGE